jgi:hypothetical protein
VATPQGKRLLANFLELTRRRAWSGSATTV